MWAYESLPSLVGSEMCICDRHPCAFETKPRNTGNADGAGRASSALALADAVVTDVVLVDDFVVDLVLLILVDVFVDDIDTVLDVVLVDAVVDEVGYWTARSR
jgi:hypothetical protein